jgi:anaerobic selenocysteine-containing dehydrogenase
MGKKIVEPLLDPREDFTIIRDALRLLREEYVIHNIIPEPWKDWLAAYIMDRMYTEEKKRVKYESVIRNINRMIAYYEQSGAQARSGKRYLRYIEDIFSEIYLHAHQLAYSLGGGVANRFMTLEDAREYQAGISVLKIFFDPVEKLFVVLRFPSDYENV